MNRVKITVLITTLLFAFIFCGAASAANLPTYTKVNITPNKISDVNSVTGDTNGDKGTYSYGSKPTLTKSSSLTTLGASSVTPSRPIIYGDKVVFEEYGSVDFNVKLWNLKTNQLTAITNDPLNWENHPRIYDNKMVWADCIPIGPMSPYYSIVYHDLNTGSTQTIASGNNNIANPSIYGTTVVWQSLSSDYTRNITWIGGPGKTATPLVYGRTPDIWGNNIVYIDNLNNNYGVYCYNIASGNVKVLSSTSTGSMSDPRINGQYVVWADSRYGDSDILMYNLATNQIKDITPVTSGQYEPAIWGNNVVWTDNRNGNYDIYGYNILTGKTTRLTTTSNNERYPSIYQNILVYSDNTQVYEQRIVPLTATASLKTGIYNTSKTVALKMSDAGTIYYTKNGSTPTTSSSKYTSPILISTTTMLKFFAKDQAGNRSPIYTIKYTIDKIAPKVSVTTPSNLKTGVSRTTTMYVKFTENIKSSVYYANIKLKNLQTGTYKTLAKSIGSSTLYIKSTSKLNANTWYQVTIPARAVKDYAGNNLLAMYTFKFKTGSY